jgi:hypothetical protein
MISSATAEERTIKVSGALEGAQKEKGVEGPPHPPLNSQWSLLI